MNPLTGAFEQLVRELDGFKTPLNLIQLASALRNANLTYADVAPYIFSNPRGYNRAAVVIRDNYELLVMTWAPGQSSTPHDHGGSVCVLQVVEGKALEANYQIREDGLAELEFESSIGRSQIVGSHDAAVHTIRNHPDSSELLVTVHIYSPPLREFRQFTQNQPLHPEVDMWKRPTRPRIVVVGGGFSGSLTAAHLLRGAQQSGLPVEVMLAERRGAVGEGVAYGTQDLHHLLNVPAGRMSAWGGSPEDFLAWARQRRPETKPGDFLPRKWYGEYVRETLLQVARETTPSSHLEVQLDEVRRITRHPRGGWMVHFRREPSIPADLVILALGHRPPSVPENFAWEGPQTRLVGDPWRQFAMNAIRPWDPVLVLGSGLTAVDTILSLTAEPRTAPITLVSRRGLLPQSHARQPVAPLNLKEMMDRLRKSAGKLSLGRLLRELRKELRSLKQSGGDWRALVDGIRPYTAELWQMLSTRERRRFLQRLRPFWEIHRHRMACDVGDRLEGLLQQGVVQLMAGQIRSVAAEKEDLLVSVEESGSKRIRETKTSWIVNCTGPTPSNSVESNPVIGSLLVSGLVRPDDLFLGIQTGPLGQAIDQHGDPVPDLFLVGTLRKPEFWESTAVPELRVQAESAAREALQFLCKQGVQAYMI